MSVVVGVIVNRTARNVDKIFHYLAPEPIAGQLTIGCVVSVPFGQADQLVDGYVVSFPEEAQTERLKEILSIVDPVTQFSPLQFHLCEFMRKKFFSTYLESIKAVTPPAHGLKSAADKYMKVSMLAVSEEEAFELLDKLRTKAPVQAKVVELLIRNDFVSNREIAHITRCSASVFRSLEEKGIIRGQQVEVFRSPIDYDKAADSVPFTPTQEQADAIEQINESVKAGMDRTFLIHGVTGSGKTEIFLQVIAETISLGKTALVLVPEIALTPQMIERFAGRFGARIAALHSKLSLGERYDQWKLIRDGKIDVVIGARSAIFAPIVNPGVIILDEEHETTYKSETAPHYHTRDIARWLCHEQGATLVLSSATPAVESYYHALEGDYQLLRLRERTNRMELPAVEIVDMRRELYSGNRSMLSVRLQEEIQNNLDEGRQTILFMNRRGYSTFVSCRNCGFVAECPNCNISLTYHKSREFLTCHYCGYTVPNYQVCPSCGSKYIRHFGSGTQKLEEEIHSVFPHARTLRMDVDSTSHKLAHEQILETFRNCEADILLGTQMVAKGLDFPNVTLVGVIAADMSLNVDDYRAGERTFSLITQVCGRAGRGVSAGRAVLQTYSPENETLKLAKSQDYPSFYQEEIAIRQMLFYPPFCDMISLLFTGQNEAQLFAYAKKIGEKIKGILAKTALTGSQWNVLGPCACVVARINNKYRVRLIVKCEITDELQEEFRSLLMAHHRAKERKFISMVIDVNPTYIN